jgi:hypothetical protein
MNLIIDTHQHMPFMQLLFPESTYVTDLDSIDKSIDYENVFLSFPTENVYLFEKLNSTSLEYQNKWRNIIKSCYELLETISYEKVCIFDSGDYPFYDDDWYVSNGYNFDKVFKVEYRKIAEKDYSKKVVSFPYMLFGLPCATKYLLDNYNPKNMPHINSCYWGSGVLLNQLSAEKGMEWILHDRLNFFNQIQDNLVTHDRVSFDEFMNTISKYKFFCILNGSGKVHRRLWEGLTFNSIPIIQKNDIIYPEGMYEPDDYLYFETPEEFKNKLEELQQNQKLYTDLMQKQMDTIITKQNLKNYILNNL